MSKELLNAETREMLKEFAAAIVTEIRKPEPATPKELADLQQKQEERRITAEGVKEQKKRERWMQEYGCKHEHSGPIGGTHCVFVKDNDVLASPGFVLCQKCQGRFRPDEPIMRKLDPGAIFNTETFNTLLTDCLQNGAEILG